MCDKDVAREKWTALMQKPRESDTGCIALDSTCRDKMRSVHQTACTWLVIWKNQRFFERLCSKTTCTQNLVFEYSELKLFSAAFELIQEVCWRANSSQEDPSRNYSQSLCWRDALLHLFRKVLDFILFGHKLQSSTCIFESIGRDSHSAHIYFLLM